MTIWVVSQYDGDRTYFFDRAFFTRESALAYIADQGLNLEWSATLEKTEVLY